MDPPQGERSISSGLSLPQWMKVKITERYDLESFSPPTEDDSFFFMRYPSKSESHFTTSTDKSSNTINEVRRKVSSTTKPVFIEPDLDLNQHTSPCRQFILKDNIDPPIQVIQSGVESRFKSAGVDDGFKTAACGKSVVEVANQMVGLKLYNGRNSEEFRVPDKSKIRQRRNSKSLPASPVVSPKSSPKVSRRNPFFSAAAYESSLDVDGKNPAAKPSGWILSSFLTPRETLEEAASREPSERGSTANIADLVEPPASTPSHGGSVSPKVLRARPSELREMNFWSPTSM